jgi:glucose-1-phosphate thymidylyltransferase
MSENYKGIILAGGKGTRLYPITKIINKHLLPIYDKPMIYYSLSVLLLAKIRDILIICQSDQINNFKKILKDGSQIGINLTYKTQDKPEGVAQALHIGEKFIGKKNIALILGDNFFFGSNFREKILQAKKKNKGATLFTYPVKNIKDFGIVTFDKKNIPISIEEKPKKSKSKLAVTGLYFYTNQAIKYAKKISLSKRNEFEITDLNRIFLKKKNINFINLDRSFYWNDAGTFDGLDDISKQIRLLESRHNFKIGDPKEIAAHNNWLP